MKLTSPCYVLEEDLLRRNLRLIRSVKESANVEIILAFKAFALWKLFPLFRSYGFSCSTASSVNEAELAFEQFGSLAHSCTPAYTDENFPVFMRYSSHITFNSLTQFLRFYPSVQAYPTPISCGLRINPEYSPVATALYNPCSPGSRLGVLREQLGDSLPEGVEGLHCHTLCESTSYELEKTLGIVESKFGSFLPHLKWLNMGGGHLMTRNDYNTDHLISVLRSFSTRHPHLRLILEPGSAFAWQTGYLLTTVVDIVENKGIKTAIIDASFSCHLPDCLEMPYQPEIRGARQYKPDCHSSASGKVISDPQLFIYRIGGNSCLSGDYMGDWLFNAPLKTGDHIIFEDMLHYTTVKTTMFNGVPHPSIAIKRSDGTTEILKTYSYEDYKNRMC
jgi:carboxynorspermidine decarboxylase